MKHTKNIAILLALVLLLQNLTVTAKASDAVGFKTTVLPSDVKPGEQVEAIVSLTGYTAEAAESDAIRGLQVDITGVDTSVLRVIEYTSLINDSTAISNTVSYNESAQRVRLAYVQMAGTLPAPCENVLKVVFQVNSDLTKGEGITLPVTVKIQTISQQITLNGECTISRSALITGNANSKLVAGKSTKLTAQNTETGEFIPASCISWTLENPEDAAYAAVTTDGTVKARAVVSRHDVTFIGTLRNGYSGCIRHTITIFPAVTQVAIWTADADVTGKTLPLNAVEGTEMSLAAKLYPADAREDVTWKSSNTKVLTVSEDGTVKYVAGTGNVTITATAADGSRRTASVKIQAGILTETVTITAPESVLLRSGKSLTLKAVTAPEKPTVPGVTFQLVNAADRVYATVTAAGRVTAKSVNGPHTVQVVAVSKDAAQVKSVPLTLNILPKSDQSLILKAGNSYVTKTTLPCNVEDTVELKAYTLSVTDEVPAGNVIWKSSKPKVAAVDETTGVVTCLAKGKTTISAVVDGKVRATVTISVTSLVEDLEIASKTGSFTVASGKTLRLIAKVVKPEAPASKAIAWTIVEGVEYAKISSSGVFTANRNLTAPATVTVQAKAKDGSGVIATQKITIKPLSYGVEIKRPNASENTTLLWDIAAEDNATMQLSAKVYPESAQQDVTWRSSNAKIAAIDANGFITFHKTGTVTITAAANDGSGKRATFKIQTVKMMKFLELSNTFIAGGRALTLKPTVEPADTTNKKLSWSVSENEAKITINASGRLSTKAVTKPVTVTVTAESLDGSGMTATCQVTVYPATAKVALTTEDGMLPNSLAVGNSLALEVISQPENAARAYTWKTSNSKVATVNEEGVVTGLKAGRVKITCTAADGTGKSISITLKVVNHTMAYRRPAG